MKSSIRRAALLAFLTFVSGIISSQSVAAAQSGPGRSSELAGLANVSGTVQAPSSFKAARVYFRNPEKRMLYMVYTSGGQYQAMHLFPGSYDVSVEAKGLKSEISKVVLKAGKNDPVNLGMQAASEKNSGSTQLVSFDEMYPRGAGLDLAQPTCIGCHGPHFLPTRHWTSAQWDGAVSMMMKIGTVTFTPEEKKTVVDWLVANFGPSSRERAVKLDAEIPVDEAKLSKAMYVEYYLKPDPAAAPNSRGRRGQDPHFDRDGNVWFTDISTPNRVSRLDPRTGEIRDWTMPANNGLHGLTVDAQGLVWLPENHNDPHLTSFDPKTEQFKRYKFDPNKELRLTPYGHSSVVDSKQNVWTSLIYGDAVAKWDRATGKMTLFKTPTPLSFPYALVIDKDDNIWISEFVAGKIARFNSKTEKWTEWPAQTRLAKIRRMNLDSRGMVWYGVFSAGKIGKLDPNTGEVIEFKVPMAYSQPYDLWPDEQDNMWFSDAGLGGSLVKYEPKTNTFSFYPTPQRADQPKLEMTREGAIWYNPRSGREGGVGVFYPDMTKITTLGAYYGMEKGVRQVSRR